MLRYHQDARGDNFSHTEVEGLKDSVFEDLPIFEDLLADGKGGATFEFFPFAVVVTKLISPPKEASWMISLAGMDMDPAAAPNSARLWPPCRK